MSLHLSQEPALYKISPLRAKSCLLNIRGLALRGSTTTEFTQLPGLIVTDSRRVGEGDVFLAYRGESSDSHKFLEDVLQKKPGLIVIEDESVLNLLEIYKVPWILVSSSRKAWSYLWAEATDQPQSKMQFLGVTGTSGKSTTMWLMRELLRIRGIESLAIGTFGYFIGEEKLPSKHTTPDPPEFFTLLKRALDQNIRIVVMEVSSHSLAQFKIEPVKFDGLGWTNFSREHLDFHKTMEDYFRAKLRFFEDFPKTDARFVIQKSLIQNIPPTLLEEHKVFLVDVRCQDTQDGNTELSFQKDRQTVSGVIPFLGDYNGENFATAWLLVEPLLKGQLTPKDWLRVSQVPGRLERVDPRGPKFPKVFVDYAHKPDALKSLLLALRKTTTGKLTCVFGCGGDRDEGKRPIMGRIAESLCERVYVTSDNPRSESPAQIAQAILEGMLSPRAPKITVQLDRKKAIEEALSESTPEDTLVIAGKGHESTQIFKHETHSFSDQEVVKEFFLKLELRKSSHD